ncbi:MAG: ABC transporter permease [Anaerolineae bacterium]|nr:ABC transporter permease [Anaerolineae bacterium]
MTRYVAQRLVMLVPVLLGITVVTFAMLRLIPGDPCRVMLGERATDQMCAAFNERMGFDDPLHVQFYRYVTSILRGDLGTSVKTGQSVVSELADRLPMTFELTLASMFVAVTVGMSAGFLAALRRGSAVDLATMAVANIGVSMPIFWLGLILMFVFAFRLQWLPPSGRTTVGVQLTPLAAAWGLPDSAPGWTRGLLDFISGFYLLSTLLTGNLRGFWDTVKHLALPAMALSTIPMSIIARMTRSSLLEVLGQDYVRTARAKGLPHRMVLLRHAMKNALLPVVTTIGLEFGYLLGGAFLTETVFSLPGVGRLVVDRILARDYPIVQGAVLVIAAVFVFVNLLVDLTYAWIDPRIHYD